MFLNFDNDAPYNHMRLVYHLFHSLTAIACGCLNNVHIDGDNLSEAHEAMYVTAALALQRDAIDMLGSMLRSVMDAAATVHLISMDAKTRRLSEANWQWDVGSSPTDRSLESPPPPIGHHRSGSVRLRHLNKRQMDDVRNLTDRFRTVLSAKLLVLRVQVLEEGIAFCNAKSVGKGIKKLIEDGYFTDSPEDAVAFLRLCGDRLNSREA